MIKDVVTYELFVASSGDITTERHRVKEQAFLWTSENCAKEKSAILPRLYEYDGYPDSVRPQDQLNQILDKCDLVVALVWYRFAEGLREELERSIAQEKPVMVYFCEKALPYGESLSPLIADFKQKYQKGVYWWTYKTPSKFQEQFQRHLSRKMTDLLTRYNKKPLSSDKKAPQPTALPPTEPMIIIADKESTPPSNALPVNQSASPSYEPTPMEIANGLSSEAQKLLIALSNDEQGIVVKSVTRAGTKLVCHSLDIPQKTPRDQAKAGEALRQLIALKLVDEFGNKGTAWKITERGFDVADVLQKPEIVVVHPPKSEFMKNFEKGFGPTR